MKTADIYIFDYIGASFWDDGVTAKSVVAAIQDAGKFDELAVHINSPGGAVDESIAIYTALRDVGKPVNVHIDGLAASAASIVAMAGDTRQMAYNASVMIHDPWGMTMGTAADMRKGADTLDHYKGVLVDTYARRTGQAPDAIATMMADETWLTAAKALELGFATSIKDDKKAAALAVAAESPTRVWDITKFKYRRVPETVAAQFSRPRLSLARQRFNVHGAKVGHLAAVAARRGQ